MLEPFPIRDLTHLDDAIREDETMGTKRKEWLVNSETRERALLKFARPGSGEDWSEKVAHEIALTLGIPCPPRLELARCGGESAVMIWSFLEKQQSLIHGNELMMRVDPDYPQGDFYRVRQHTLSAVSRVVSVFAAPPTAPEGFSWNDGFDVFVGYLLLDALVGNTDRHHQNWGVVVEQKGSKPFLAPSYDHASCLGRELDDIKRKRRFESPLGRGHVQDYALKALSAVYANDGRLLAPVEAFSQSASIRRSACVWWRARLLSVGLESLCAPLDRVPDARLSSVGRDFARRLLAFNFERIEGLEL